MISLKNITKSFKLGENEIEILHGINLEIKKGEFIAIIVPSIGIKKDENGTFVYVLKDGKPVKTAVKTGIKDNLDTQIISGINEGDEIITSQGSSSEIAKMIAKEHKKF